MSVALFTFLYKFWEVLLLKSKSPSFDKLLHVEHLLPLSKIVSASKLIEIFRGVVGTAQLLILRSRQLGCRVTSLHSYSLRLLNFLCKLNFLDFMCGGGPSSVAHLCDKFLWISTRTCRPFNQFSFNGVKYYGLTPSSSCFVVANSRRRGRPVCLLLCKCLACLAPLGRYFSCPSLVTTRPHNCLSPRSSQFSPQLLGGSLLLPALSESISIGLTVLGNPCSYVPL